MKRLLSRFLASPLSVWAAWIGLFGWSWFLLSRGEMHPAWWPFISLFVLLMVSVLVQVVRLILAFAKRQQRLATVRSFCLAMIPVVILAAHVSYVYLTTQNRLVKIGPLTLSLAPTFIVAAELETHCRYPYKTTGERVVMFHHGAENAREQVAAADAHLARLAEVLGHPSKTMIHWIRGPVLGRDSYSFFALAMGSSWEEDQITTMDKHELAHAAISQHLTKSARMPMMLVEGWAEAVSAEDPSWLWSSAAWEAEWAPSIRELAAPPWAYIDDGPVYMQGGPFIDMLVDEYGGEKFFELYHTCSPETFDDDCRRVFGMGLDAIEQQYESRLAEWSEGRRIRELLESLPVAESVDREDWQQFVADYSAAVDRSDILPEYEAEEVKTYVIPPNEQYPEGHERRDTEKVILTDHLHAAVDDRQAVVITHDDSFRLRRGGESQPWGLSWNYAQFPAMSRWFNHLTFQLNDPGPFRPEFGRSRTYRWKQHPPQLKMFQRTQGEQGEQCRLVLEYVPETGEDEPFTLDCTFDRNSNWRVVKFAETRFIAEGEVSEYEYQYIFNEEGILSSIETRGVTSKLDGELVYELERRLRYSKPSNIDPADYTLAAFGIEEDTRVPISAIPTLTLIFLGAAAGQLCLGLLLYVVPRREKQSTAA